MRTITVLESLPFIDKRIFLSSGKVVSKVHGKRKESGWNGEKQRKSPRCFRQLVRNLFFWYSDALWNRIMNIPLLLQR